MILKKPLLGGIIAILLDYFDFAVLWGTQSKFLGNYQQVDKLLDIHYLALEVLVILNWKKSLLKKVILVLFGYRLIGVFLFEITRQEFLLFLFPNFFENIFLLILAINYLKNKFDLVKTPLFFKTTLALTLIIKLYQELSLHIIKTSPWLGANILGLK